MNPSFNQANTLRTTISSDKIVYNPLLYSENISITHHLYLVLSVFYKNQFVFQKRNYHHPDEEDKHDL